MNRCLTILAHAILAHASLLGLAAAAERALARPADANETKYTFLLFHRDNGAATEAMAATLKRGLAAETDRAVVAFVDVNNPAEKTTVARYGVSRAPLPLVVAVAPNGAITGMFPKKVTDSQIATAFVTPGMAHSMKAMQQGKLVVVCIKTSSTPVPAGVQDFQQDAEFKNRTEVISLERDDPSEADFLKQLKVDPAQVAEPTVAFLAPPAVLVGKFGAKVTKEEMATALHAAGKCCDDPNCKHNHSHGKAKVTKQPAAPARQATQNPAGRRN